MKIEDFNDTQPVFIPQEYFNGKMTAYGIVKDRSGKVIKTFKGDLVGSWNKDGVGTLNENFIYNDGKKLNRVWTIKPTLNPKEYIGTAGDIIGDSLMKVNGNTLMIDYTMNIPYNEGTINIDVKDWLHLQDNGVIINHSKMRKYGFVVGELIITIIKNQ
jgi:hypothetical protein